MTIILHSAGNISARIGDNFVDGISENLRYGFEKFGRKGFENSGSDRSDKSSRDSGASGSGSLILESTLVKSKSISAFYLLLY